MRRTPPGQPWFVGRPADPAAEVRLICLPYAGRGAGAFHGWSELLGRRVDVRSLQLGGRENRWRDPADIDVPTIAAALAELTDLPYVVYGHSLGGRLGYEIVRELHRTGHRMPSTLVVGGSSPVDLPNEGELVGVSRASDDELVRRVAGLGGIPDEVLADEDLVELLLPAIRGDFRWIDDYRWRAGPPLPVPIRAICGSQDRVCPPMVGVGWSRHSAPGFSLRTVPGGHFFLHEQQDLMRAELCRALFPAEHQDGRRPAPGPDAVHLEFARSIGSSPPAGLSADEQQRAARFVRPDLAQRYAFRRTMARDAVQRSGYRRPGDWGGGAGKPTVEGGPELSWSHREQVTLVGISAPGRPVGVDVETIRQLPDFEILAGTALSRRERSAVMRHPDPIAAFLWLWTAKEAVLKASGDGLSIDPTTVEFDESPSIRPTRPARAPTAELRAWWVHPLRLPGAIAAVAADRPLTDWTVDEVVPASAPQPQELAL